MQIELTGNHVDITPALREYVESKFGRIERHFDHLIGIHVVLSIEKQRHKAEATVHAGRARVFADAVEGDMYAAIDAMMDKIDRQVKKHKEKITNHRSPAEAKSRRRT
ncbi:MAG: ribosome hibernation-promoting factor, HPF/YfiA family [Chromatiales bacterium]